MRTVTRTGTVVLAAGTLITTSPAFASAEAPRVAREGASPLEVVGAEDIASVTSLRDLESIVGIQPGLQPNQPGGLSLRGLVQTQYGINHRRDSTLGDDDTTIGFSNPIVQFTAAANITENIDVVISAGTAVYGNGQLGLNDGFINIKTRDDLSFQIGQFRPAIRREDKIHESQLDFGSYSVSGEFFGTRRHQGIQGVYDFGGDSSRLFFGVTDGPDSADTEFNSPGEYDYSFHGRFEYKPYGDWSQFIDTTSFRGSNDALLIGLGGYYASEGDTNPASITDRRQCGANADINFESDGYHLGATLDWFREENSPGADYDFFGWSIFGGYFFTPQLELAARIEQILVDDDLALPTDNFLFAGVALNYYLVPDSHAAKLIVDAQIALDETVSKVGFGATSWGPVGPTSATGFQSSGEDNQLLFRVTLSTVY